MSNVAIIGAGICGLRCAQLLQEAGVTVELFDKGRGVGGRLATRRHAHWRFDHGAPSLHGDGPGWREKIRGYPIWSRTHETMECHVPEHGVNQLAKDIARSLSILNGCQITSIVQHANGWHLYDDQAAEHGPFDDLVITAPCPQTQVLIENLDTPLKQQLSNVRMNPAWVMMLATTTPIITATQQTPTHNLIRRISAEHSKPKRAINKDEYCYVLEATAGWSQRHEDDAPTDVQTHLLEALKDVTVEMIKPLHCAVHRWRYAHTQDAVGKPYLMDEDLRLGVAGDWCLGRGADGAYQSGEDLAAALLHAKPFGA